MPGKGKHGHEFEILRLTLDADSVVGVVIGGTKGPGVSMAIKRWFTRQERLAMADALQGMVRQLRKGDWEEPS